jgi:hypothetical protein
MKEVRTKIQETGEEYYRITAYGLFNQHRKNIPDDIAAAIVTLADVIDRHEQVKSDGMPLGHEICMGIRKGLFGANATDESTINGSRQ